MIVADNKNSKNTICLTYEYYHNDCFEQNKH